MGHLSDDECREPDSCTDSPLRRNEVARTSRDVEAGEAGEYTIDGPVILGPGLPPEDGSCVQFAVQFHVTTATVVGLKRIADARGLSAPELYRQVVGDLPLASRGGSLREISPVDSEAVVGEGLAAHRGRPAAPPAVAPSALERADEQVFDLGLSFWRAPTE